MEKNFGVGDILRETMTNLSEASRGVAIYVLALGGLGAIGVLAGLTPVESSEFGIGYGVLIDQNSTLGSGLFDLLVAAISVVASYMLVKQYLLVRGKLHSGENRFWPYLGMLILSFIGLLFSFILFIVPGFIVLVRWSAASGFLVGAGSGVTQSLTDSWHATKGHSWAIFFAILILFIGLAVVFSIIGAILGLLGGLVGAAMIAFLDALGNAVAIAFGIGVYSLVHDDAAEIGEVFS